MKLRCWEGVIRLTSSSSSLQVAQIDQSYIGEKRPTRCRASLLEALLVFSHCNSFSHALLSCHLRILVLSTWNYRLIFSVFNWYRCCMHFLWTLVRFPLFFSRNHFYCVNLPSSSSLLYRSSWFYPSALRFEWLLSTWNPLNNFYVNTNSSQIINIQRRSL